MYIKNIGEERDDDKFYCTKELGTWLIYSGHLPLFARTKSGWYVFIKTDRFKESIGKAPAHLKFINKLRGGG